MSKTRSLNRVPTSSDLARKYPGSGLASKVLVTPEDALWIPSRNIYLNYTMGGGVKYGTICEIFGSESSGKSLVAMDFGYVTQYLGGIILWNDAEQSFDPLWAQKNGLKLDRVEIYNETSIERISDWAADLSSTYRAKLTHNEPILIVHDSIAALDCEVNINSAQVDSKAEMGNRAKALYKYLRIRNQHFADLGVTLIFINQLRKKVGATKYEDPDTTPGGDAMKFFAAQRMAFFRKKRITAKIANYDNWVGNEVSVRMKKNKVAPPRPTFDTEIYFNDEYGKIGFNKYCNLPEMFERAGVITRGKGSSHYYFGEDRLAQGEDNFKDLLDGDADIRSKLIRASGVNTVSLTQKKLRKLSEEGTNRYPLKIKTLKKVSKGEDQEVEYEEE